MIFFPRQILIFFSATTSKNGIDKFGWLGLLHNHYHSSFNGFQKKTFVEHKQQENSTNFM